MHPRRVRNVAINIYKCLQLTARFSYTGCRAIEKDWATSNFKVRGVNPDDVKINVGVILFILLSPIACCYIQMKLRYCSYDFWLLVISADRHLKLMIQTLYISTSAVHNTFV